MAKGDQIIMTIERAKLFNNDQFNGAYSGEIDFESRILSSIKWMRRGDAETDSKHKQPIGYCLVINPALKKVFAYKRASKEEKYTETRLHGKWSWGVGGHIEQADVIGNPIRESMKREIAEEVKMDGKIYDIIPLGYINDESDEVGSVHFGILYAALTDSKEVKPTHEHEMALGEFMSLAQLEEICISQDCFVESWSRIALEPLRNYLK